MSLSYIIEIGSKAVGLVHRESESHPFIFIASDRRFASLEGQAFQQPRHAERAARQHSQRRPAQRKPVAWDGVLVQDRASPTFQGA